MISTTREGKESKFKDESEFLDKTTLALVQAALCAGLTEFTTPTPEDDEGRTDWKARRWVTMKNGKPACYLVAYKTEMAHFEILGPEIDIASTAPTPTIIAAIAPTVAAAPVKPVNPITPAAAPVKAAAKK